MLRAVFTDVRNGVVEIGNDFHVQIQRQKLIVVLLRIYGNNVSRAT
jgi:hypothetical protein